MDNRGIPPVSTSSGARGAPGAPDGRALGRSPAHPDGGILPWAQAPAGPAGVDTITAGPIGSDQPALNGGGADAADDLDLITADPRSRRLGPARTLLVAGIAAAIAFGAGVVTQKGHDRGLTGTSSGARAPGAMPGGGEGFPAGAAGLPGQAGSAGSGASGAAAAAGTNGGTNGGTGTGSSSVQPPVVVGTVAAVQGSTLTVRNFAGTQVTVTVPSTASVTMTGLGGIQVGSTVTVAGSKGTDGTVTATAVTVRVAG